MGRVDQGEAEKELAEFYPKDPDGATPIAYLWARTIQCEGPGCGAEVPLIRSLWLSRKQRAHRATARAESKAKRVDFQIIVKQRDGWVDQANPNINIKTQDSTVRKTRFSDLSLLRLYDTVARVREQFKTDVAEQRRSAVCGVQTHTSEQGRLYRLPTDRDLRRNLRRRTLNLTGADWLMREEFLCVPKELTSLNEIAPNLAPPIYGMTSWGDLFTHVSFLRCDCSRDSINVLCEKQEVSEIAASCSDCSLR